MLMARLRSGIEGASLSGQDAPAIITAREVLELATIGGASVLGRQDIGSLESGKCADFIAIDLNCLDYAGALHDPVAAVLFCTPQNVALQRCGRKDHCERRPSANIGFAASHRETQSGCENGWLDKKTIAIYFSFRCRNKERYFEMQSTRENMAQKIKKRNRPPVSTAAI